MWFWSVSECDEVLQKSPLLSNDGRESYLFFITFEKLSEIIVYFLFFP